MKQANFEVDPNEYNYIGIAAAMEAKRLSEKYGKDTFVMEDIMEILSIGMHNARKLMMSDGFPILEIGGRKVVPALSLALWIASKDKGV